MNSLERLIIGICQGDEAVKIEVNATFFHITQKFVVANNKALKVDIKERYIFDDVIGLINMRFTSTIKNLNSIAKINAIQFDHLIYFLTKQIYLSEFCIKPELPASLNFGTDEIEKKIVETGGFSDNDHLMKLFDDTIQTRKNELLLIRKVMVSNSLREFNSAYFDLAIDIVNKGKGYNLRLDESEVHEYAKDIFSEAVLKLITLIQKGQYVYEAKISSFLYWPMFNKWAKLSRDLGVDIGTSNLEDISDTNENNFYFDTQLEKDELKKLVNDTFKKLSERERQILWLKDAEGYSYQEIKEMLNLSEEINYLKQIKLRGKRNLIEKLKNDKRFNELFS